MPRLSKKPKKKQTVQSFGQRLQQALQFNPLGEDIANELNRRIKKKKRLKRR